MDTTLIIKAMYWKHTQMSVQTGRPSNSKKIGLHYIVRLPVYMLWSVKRIRVKHQELLPDGWNKTITTRQSLFPIHQKDLEKIKSKMSEDSILIDPKQMGTRLPIFCLSCEREGKPEFNEEKRIYKEGKTPTLRIYYNHNSDPKRCYVGTWKDGQTALKQGIDQRKMGTNYWLKKMDTLTFERLSDIP